MSAGRTGSALALGIYKDEQLKGCKTWPLPFMASGRRIVVQISHAGYAAVETLTGQTPLALPFLTVLPNRRAGR
jgi:2,4-dienoyl-CoA reductase-like NADH-dependent reductase (Old Yellow Enzyme family)